MEMSDIVKEHQEYIRNNIQGIGRLAIVVSVKGTSYYLPKLHFLLYGDVLPDKSECSSAYCIELGFQHSHKNPEIAINGLIEICKKQFELLLNSLDKKSPREEAYNKILDHLELHDHEGYWAIFRRVNFKNSLKHSKTADQPEPLFRMFEQQNKAIQDLYQENKRLKSLLNQKAENMPSPSGAYELLQTA